MVYRLRVYIESKDPSKKSKVLYSTMNLIDLAGSESGNAHKDSKSSSSKHEMLNINRSLLTLTTVISKLSEKSNQWIPYRDSKLTKYMENALQGNAKISIICNISPGEQSYDQSQSTLNFAMMAKKIKQTVQKNEAPNNDQTMIIIRLEAEIKALKKKLRMMEENRMVEKPVGEEEEMVKTKDKLQQLTSKITTGALIQKSVKKENLPATFQVRVSQIMEALGKQSKIEELRMSVIMEMLSNTTQAKALPFQIYEDKEEEDKEDKKDEDDVIGDDEFQDARGEFDSSTIGENKEVVAEWIKEGKEKNKVTSTRHSTNRGDSIMFDSCLFKFEDNDDTPIRLENDLIFEDNDFLTNNPSVNVPDYFDVRISSIGPHKVDKTELKSILQKAEDVIVDDNMDDLRKQLVESDKEKQKLKSENKELTVAVTELTELLETTLAELKEYRSKYGKVYSQ